jgi:hypothetical protein
VADIAFRAASWQDKPVLSRLLELYQTGGNFVEHELHDERWDGFLQCFDNGRIP